MLLSGGTHQRAPKITMTTKTPRTHLKVKETAELLGVAPNTVRAWAAAGRLPEYRHPVNNYRLFRRSDVEALARTIGEPPLRSKHLLQNCSTGSRSSSGL